MKRNLIMNRINNKIWQYILVPAILCAGMITAQAATYTVTNTNDSGAGSLRDAVGQANASTDNDTIDFAPSLAGQTITLTGGELTIATGSGSLTINGLGADQLSVSGNNQSRVFQIHGGANLTVNKLTVKAGTGDGGCILSSGVLTINDSVITGCTGIGYGGGIYHGFDALTINSSVITGNSTPNSFGGGIFSFGATTITKSTISSNNAFYAGGLAIAFSNFVSITDTTFTNNTTVQQGTILVQNTTGATMTNTTISGNFSQNFGAGIHNLVAQLSLINCTVANNTAQGAFGAILTAAPGTTTLANTLVAANSPKNFSDAVISGGYNLDTDGTSGFVNGANGDIVGTLANPIDAMLAPLADNGGPTFTRALLMGSPAIDAGNSTLTIDQRGFSRPINIPSIPNAGSGTDIGAFEYQGATPTDKDQCKNGGWRTFDFPRTFINQGDCIQFVNTGK
jgi:hypothetical protein